MPALQEVVHLPSVHQLGGLQIERENLAGPELALLEDILRLVIPHARFGGDGDVAVLGDHPARRAQPVAIERAAREPSVGEHDARGAVPGLHVRRVVLVEGLEIRIDHVDRLPGRRNQHAHRVHRIEAAHQQQLQHVVERAGVRPRERHHRQHIGEVGQERRAEQGAASHRPGAISLHGIDLAIVGQVAVRVREPPLGQRVGGEALVKHRDRGLHARIGEVRVELHQVLRHDHALVDDGARRQRRDIERRVGLLEDFLGPPARHVELAVEGRLVDIGARIHENLFDVRQRLERLVPAGARVDVHHAEPRDLHLFPLDLDVEHAARLGRLDRVAVEEHQARRELWTQGKARLLSDRAQEARRRLDEQTAAIPGLAVGRNGAAVGQPVQGGDGGLHHPMAGVIVETRDQSKTARIPLVPAAIQAPILGARIHHLICLIRHITRP